MARETVYETNLVSLIQKFGSDEKCRAHLERLRWPSGVSCPRCQSRKISRVRDRGQFDCDSCRYQFSVTSGTMMHDTHLPLWKWFLAIYMMVESKKGVSANQLKRTLEVSYRTAWYLCHRIRRAFETKAGLLRGVVEIDETWIGGKAKSGRSSRGSRPNYMRNKTMVIGAVTRGGDIRLHAAHGKRSGRAGTAVIRQFIGENIDKTATVYTDTNNAYPRMLKGYAGHAAVNHSHEEYAREGGIHTNTIEGAWGLFKRSIVGAFHQVSFKHLDAYLDEFEFRYNNRKNAHIFTDALRLVVEGEHLEYRELVESKSS